MKFHLVQTPEAKIAGIQFLLFAHGSLSVDRRASEWRQMSTMCRCQGYSAPANHITSSPSRRLSEQLDQMLELAHCSLQNQESLPFSRGNSFDDLQS